MNGILGTPYNDKVQKRTFYNNSRRRSRTSASWQRQLIKTPKLVWVGLGCIVILFYMLSGTRPRLQSLRNQPVYQKHPSSCTAELCNPLKKCSNWSANKKYDWSDLSKAGIFRDLSTVQLSAGCSLKLKVDGRADEGEWLLISEGQTTCVDSGYGVQCRNLVDIEFEETILIKAKEMKRKMQEPSYQHEELVVVQHDKKITNKKTDVTLITQFSVNRLEPFKNAIKAWPGPLSIAIYLTHPRDIEELIEFFKVKENQALYSHATIAIVKPNYNDNDHLNYPINHLRNIAITESDTDYYIVIDADFTPSNNLYSTIRTHLIPYIAYQGQTLPTTAWVVPCFAMREEFEAIALPENYSQLRPLMGKGIAYITDPGAGHGPTLATEVGMSHGLLMGNPLAYEVCYESQWEPYYVLHRSAPLYDARFKNQGGDKQSHALQLNAEGYRFMVLREVFMIHRDHPSMVWPGGGFLETQKAPTDWNYFVHFMREMEELYGGLVRWPRGCGAAAIGWQEQRRDTLGFAAGAI